MARDDDLLTIDQLAQRSGMTARNIRAHQSRGLLPPPEVRGRTGYYRSEHLERIELIRELQGEGYSLDLIRRLFESSNGSSAEVLRFTRALREPFAQEEPEIVSAEELAAGWEGADPRVIERAEKLGVVRTLPDGRYEVLTPRLLRAAEELLALGASPDDLMDVAGRLRRHADSVAQAFVRLFVEAVWKPFDREGRPEDRWPAVSEALERVRPLAADSLLAVFRLAMDDAVEQGFGRELQRIESEGDGRRGRRRSRRNHGSGR